MGVLRARTLFVLIALVLIARTGAWWCTGHMVVAYLATQNMAPETVSKLEDFLQDWPWSSEASGLVETACWADDIKGDTRAFDVWHYVDFPFNPDTLPDVPTPASVNVASMTTELMASLRKHKSESFGWAFALRMLIHLVGDMHQPLHCVTLFNNEFPPPAGDRGGNLFDISGEDVPDLHAFWDSVGLTFEDYPRPLTSKGWKGVKEKVEWVKEMVAKHPEDIPSDWARFNATAWAVDTFHQAMNVAYTGIQPGDTPTDDYHERLLRSSARGLWLGGMRLATLLNQTALSMEGAGVSPGSAPAGGGGTHLSPIALFGVVCAVGILVALLVGIVIKAVSNGRGHGEKVPLFM